MPAYVTWESSKTPHQVEQFKEDYANEKLSLREVAEYHGMSPSVCHSVAGRLGLRLRHSDPQSLKQIEDEIAAAERRLRELQQMKEQLSVFAEDLGDGRVRVHGLGEEIVRHKDEWRNFLKGNGPTKVRVLLDGGNHE